MSVPRGMTPSIKLTVPEDVDLTLMDDIVVSFDCNGVKVHKTGESLVISAHSIEVSLTQEDTLIFKEEWDLYAQINWLLDGTRGGTDVCRVCRIGKQLYEQVMQITPTPEPNPPKNG